MVRKLFTSAAKASSSHVQAARSVKTLQERVTELIPEKQAEIVAFRKKHNDTKIGDINVGMVYGGMRGMKAMVWETSVLDADEGIRFQGMTIPDCQEVLPAAFPGGEPLPEALFWLLVTGEVPSDEQVKNLSADWASRGSL